LKNIENILKNIEKILKKYIVENICSIFYHPIFRREILSNSEESQLQAKNTGYSVKN
jgi:hypothetical protein